MDNNTITVSPGQDTSLEKYTFGGRPGLFRPSPVDRQGRERRHVFVRRMNSAALALFADTLLVTILLFVVLMVAFFIAGMSSLASLDFSDLMQGIASGDSSRLSLLVLISVTVATFLGHTIPAYMHSARNNFSLFSTLRPGSRLGLALPAAIIVALGITYSWVFIYEICGDLLPESFFASKSFYTSSFNGMDTVSMLVSAANTAILVPIAEEILFRGALLKSFSKYGIGFAVFASSFLFGLMHGNMFQTPFATLGGIVMAYVVVRSGSIWPSIAIHISINSYSVICEIIKTLVAPDRLEMLYYIITGISGLFILGAVLILCTCAKKISWTPIDSSCNNALLPVVDSKVRCKPLRFFLSFGIMLFVVVYLFAILIDCGLFMPDIAQQFA